ncbi:MAG: hypothetical protein ACL7BU_14370 [Candidatus Phlomobacter fragariae]
MFTSSEQTRQAATRLESYPIEQLSDFLPKALLSENAPHGVNHSNEDNIYAVNFNHLAQVASEYRQNIPNLSEIKSLLKIGKTRRFMGIKTMGRHVNSPYNQAVPTMSTLKNLT